MIAGNLRYITDRSGHVHEVVVPAPIFKKMVEAIEDRELLRVMKEVEEKSDSYLSEDESFELLDSLIESSEIQA